MKVLLLLLGLATAEVLTAESGNAISRVVKLMREFSDKLDAEIKAEANLCKKYDCWCENTAKTCEANISDSKATVSELTSEAESLGANTGTEGSFELSADWQDKKSALTPERKMLQDADAKAKKDLKDEEARRKEERELYEKNHEIKVATLEGVKAAAQKICDGRGDNGANCKDKYENQQARLDKDRMASVEDKVHAALLQSTSGPLSAMELDDAKTAAFRVLMDQYGNEDPSDYAKLSMLLLQQPQAGGDKKYTGHLGKINTVLNDMFDNVWDEFVAMQEQEEANGTSYVDKMSALQAAADEANKKFTELAGEKKAREERLAEINDEVNDLNSKIEFDQKTIETTKKDQEKQRNMCDKRAGVRNTEKEGVDAAIASLNADRNKFGNVAFLQTEAQCTPTLMLQSMSSKMSTAAARAGSLSLLAAAQMLRQSAPSTADKNAFEPVFAKIAEMLTQLDDEDAQDQTDLDNGKKALSKLSKKIKANAEDGDKFLATMRTNDAEAETQRGIIANCNKEIESLEQQKATAKANEADRLAEWEQRDAEDQLVLEALKKAYKLMNAGRDEGSQSGAVGSLAQFGPGEAPPPPPKTAAEEEGDYKADEAGSSILTMISIIYKGVEKDKASAASENSDSIADHEDLQQKLTDDISSTTTAKDEAQNALSDATKNSSDARGSADTQGATVMASVNDFGERKKGPNYLGLNFQTRRDNRASERSALKMARSTLKAFAATVLLQGKSSMAMSIPPHFCA